MLAPRNLRFSIDAAPGFVAYRAQGRHRVALGGVHATRPLHGALRDRFLGYAASRRRRVLVVQLRASQVALFRERGFAVRALDSSFGISLGRFTLRGTPFVVDGKEFPGANRLAAWAVPLLYRYGHAIYPAASQVQYKLKWTPDVVECEYLAARPLSLRAILDLLLLTRSL